MATGRIPGAQVLVRIEHARARGSLLYKSRRYLYESTALGAAVVLAVKENA